jgi:hypothetical protein
MSSFLSGVFKVIVAIVIIFGAYLVWMVFDTSAVKDFCADVHPGSQFSSLPELAKKHGVNTRFLSHGIPASDGPGFITFVPAASTYGEGVCAIRYNEGVVISAAISGM